MTGLWARRSRIPILGGAREFYFLQNVQIGCGDHAASCTVFCPKFKMAEPRSLLYRVLSQIQNGRTTQPPVPCSFPNSKWPDHAASCTVFCPKFKMAGPRSLLYRVLSQIQNGRTTQPPVPCSFPNSKWPGRVVEHLPPAGTEFANEWVCTPRPSPPAPYLHDGTRKTFRFSPYRVVGRTGSRNEINGTWA